MPKRNVDQQAEITQGELLLHLERSGRVGFTKRRLTQFTSRGLLPSLRHTTRFWLKSACVRLGSRHRRASYGPLRCSRTGTQAVSSASSRALASWV